MSFNKIVKILIIIAIIVLLLIMAGKRILFPPFEEIKPTGRYEIDCEDYWVVEDKIEPFLNTGSMREVQVRAWYPQNYDASAEKQPVIVASHGSCGTIDNNISLYKELASHGYVVLALCHPGHAFEVEHSDGTKQKVSTDFLKEMTIDPQKNPEKAAMLFQHWMELRMDDISAVMDDFAEKSQGTDTFLSADTSRFVTIGHSAGGSAALGMARIREDVVGVIALESPFMYDIKGVKDGEYIFDSSDYTVPMLNIYSDSSYAHLREWKQYKNNALFLDSANDNYNNIYYDGTGHMGLCDLSLISPVLANLMDGKKSNVAPARQLKKLNEDCLEFLHKVAENSDLTDISNGQSDFNSLQTIEIVNLRGDYATIYQSADGKFYDGEKRIYTYNGTDTWTDPYGVEWNEAVPQNY